MKMIYESALGLEPVEVEVLEIDFDRDSAVILMPLGKDTLANLFLREEGKPEIRYVQRSVPRSLLRPLSS